jgi:hypothetical protein
MPSYFLKGRMFLINKPSRKNISYYSYHRRNQVNTQAQSLESKALIAKEAQIARYLQDNRKFDQVNLFMSIALFKLCNYVVYIN